MFIWKYLLNNNICVSNNIYRAFLLPYPGAPVVAVDPGEAEHAPHHLLLLPLLQLLVLLPQHHTGLRTTGEAGIGANLQ